MYIFEKFEKWIRRITVIELSIAAFAFALMVICYFISVVNRNLIKLSVPWTEELALYCMVYVTLLGMEVGLRDGTQVAVTALTDKLKGSKLGALVRLISMLVTVLFAFFMLKYGYALFERQLRTGQTSPVLEIPMYMLYFSLVISFGFTLITQLLILIGKVLHISTDGLEQIDPLIDSLFEHKRKA